MKFESFSWEKKLTAGQEEELARFVTEEYYKKNFAPMKPGLILKLILKHWIKRNYWKFKKERL